MKQELKAVVDAWPMAPSGMRDIFLAALHWRGDELWCGPILVSYFWQPDPKEWHNSLGFGPGFGPHSSEEEVRAFLRSTAREQIINWFKEQAE